MYGAIAICFAIVLSLVGNPAKADLNGFVHLPNDHQLYVNYLAPEPGKPTLVILNGLTYSTESWNPFVQHLQSTGLGILRYDMMGQGRTLHQNALSPEAFTYESQVQDLAHLLDRPGTGGVFTKKGRAVPGGDLISKCR